MAHPFHVRFNIEVPIEKAQERFVNRIANQVRKICQTLPYRLLDGVLFEVEATLGEPHPKFLDEDPQKEFMERWIELINGAFLRSLQAVEGLYKGIFLLHLGNSTMQEFNDTIAQALTESEVDIGISWQEGYFEKKGVELLDKELVNEPIGWLADPKYENLLVPFKKGLSHLLEGTKDSQRYGDAVTDMYEALEAMAKIVTGKPTKDLSALREEFISTLRLPETHKLMLKQYIEYAGDFRHALESGQKRAWPLEHEAENFVYLTGLFIRLAIQAEKAG